ncbi:unnamed protein product [Ostreobium quekettii]|uniref:Uncharacterized protein n=1 Tax=Ostreobium quekettii TaxID=121088 RepID=A0A8S1JDQ4_9CHLO|nr:unnamed protein product [Ostreobium quekettii]
MWNPYANVHAPHRCPIYCVTSVSCIASRCITVCRQTAWLQPTWLTLWHVVDAARVARSREAQVFYCIHLTDSPQQIICQDISQSGPISEQNLGNLCLPG